MPLAFCDEEGWGPTKDGMLTNCFSHMCERLGSAAARDAGEPTPAFRSMIEPIPVLLFAAPAYLEAKRLSLLSRVHPPRTALYYLKLGAGIVQVVLPFGALAR